MNELFQRNARKPLALWGGLLAGLAGLLLLGCTESRNAGGSYRDAERMSMVPGNYQLVFSVNTSLEPAPVTGVELTVQLPAGVAIATDAEGRIQPSALSAGSALKGAHLLTGRTVSGKQQAVLSLSTAATSAWSGEFARLTLAIPEGMQLSSKHFNVITCSGFPSYKAVGLGAPRSSAVLQGTTKPSVSLQKL